MEDLLAMVLLVTNKGKHYACVIGEVQLSNPTARPSAQVMMKTTSKRFSTIASLKSVFFSLQKCRQS